MPTTSPIVPRTPWTFIHLIFFCGILIAAVSPRAIAGPAYAFTLDHGEYHELENATPIPIMFGDTVFRLDMGGEIFSFFRKPFAIAGAGSFEIAGDGFLRVWDDSTVMVIDGVFTRLDTVDASTQISYAVEGAPGDRVLKVQWRRMGFLAGLDADYVNFQIWVYQRSGTIEIHYGSSDVKGASAFGDGPWTGAFISPSTFTTMTEKLWITGDPAKPTIDRLKNFQFKRLNSLPAAGTIYRLTLADAAGVKEMGWLGEMGLS